MTPRILLLYYLHPSWKKRKSIADHLYSFRRYGKGARFHYLDTFYGLPRYLSWGGYDGVILHYTLLSMRWDPKNFPKFMHALEPLKRIRAPKVAIPQDEYAHTADLWRMFREYGVETVFTLAPKEAYAILYPKKEAGLRYRFTVFPGYVDEQTLAKIRPLVSRTKERPIDIGHRARTLQFWIGRYAQKKAEVGEVVKTYCWKHTNLVTDISSEEKDVLEEEAWIKFLLQCKAVLGVEGGTQLFDRDGAIRACVEAYSAAHPDASFAEVEAVCFPGQDGKLPYLTTSPRLFEAAMTKTCQILVEGRYSGIVRPNVHYISLKPDYSNLSAVIVKFLDVDFRKRIVANAYRDLVRSRKYTYRRFAQKVTDHIRRLASHSRSPVRASMRSVPVIVDSAINLYYPAVVSSSKVRFLTIVLFFSLHGYAKRYFSLVKRFFRRVEYRLYQVSAFLQKRSRTFKKLVLAVRRLVLGNYHNTNIPGM